jgi:glyoxylase-like metal-dependent hydrolase (beta-lactamase superfamily II)
MGIMFFDSFPVGPLGCNTTILGDSNTHDAIVIDPGDEAPRIYAKLAAQSLTVRQILITHAHIDHIGSAVELKELTGAPIYLNEKDLPLLASMAQQAAWLGMAPPKTAPPDERLDAGQLVGLPNYQATVLHTPGHTQGSVCLHFADLNLLIAGDTLFAASIGRTDLPGGNYEQIIESIHTQLLPLPDSTRVICGHGPETTIGAERGTNPFLIER